MKTKASQKRAPIKTPAKPKPNRPEQPIIAFASAAQFSLWLDQNHADHPGIWMRIYPERFS